MGTEVITSENGLSKICLCQLHFIAIKSLCISPTLCLTIYNNWAMVRARAKTVTIDKVRLGILTYN